MRGNATPLNDGNRKVSSFRLMADTANLPFAQLAPNILPKRKNITTGIVPTDPTAQNET